MIGEISIKAENGHTHVFRFEPTGSGMSALVDHWEELIAAGKTDLTPLDFAMLSLQLKEMICKLLLQESPFGSSSSV